MRSLPKITLGLETAAKAANLRKFGRVVCQDIRCSLGPVLDLSATGMRVKTRSTLGRGQVFTIVIDGLDGPVALAGTVQWVRRCGIISFSREIGILFTDVPQATANALCRLARAAAHNETMRDDIAAARKSA